MNYRVNLKIAGVKLEFQMTRVQTAERLKKKYGLFLVQSNLPDYSFQVFFSKETFHRSMKPQVLYRDGSILGRRKNFKFTSKSGQNILHIHDSIYAFDAFLRVFLGTIIIEKNGMLVHASGVAVRGKALVFAGISGAGKTTLSRLVPGHILNDEIVAVVQEAKCWKVWGTPFWGEMKNGPYLPKSFPLRHIFSPKKAKENHLVRLNLDVAVAHLLRCICFFSADQMSSLKILNLTAQLVSEVGLSELHFKKDTSFLPLLEVHES